MQEANKKGELCVAGTALALGYYQAPEQTRRAFVQNPLNPYYPETIYGPETLHIIMRPESFVTHPGKISRSNIWDIGLNWARSNRQMDQVDAMRTCIAVFFIGEETDPCIL